ncbi:hypothetical protein [Dyadobacter sp. CY323]|uniref:hypothetical protein n=1 Tax=Dyadobacter sp. CY323 TaxID=2907302 RepID=UPI001F30599A|nr:hypothetical protein [Dyadobacter sp. CY323]MCE6987497.1 hypothetical protein [Dyadobacter sp. CY323]
MKRILSLLFLLASFQPGALAQIELNVKVTLPDSIVGKKYLENFVKQAIKDQAVKPPVIPPVVIPPVTVEKKACTFGPVLTSISDESNSGLKFGFNGLGVDTLAYDIYSSGGGFVISGSVAPKSSTLLVNFPAQPNGSYQLKIRGKSCKSADSEKSFLIKSDQGGIVVPVPDKPNPGTSKPGSLYGRHQYMNTTGDGFDIHDPHGIVAKHRHSADILLNLEHNGEKFKGIDGVRINMKWAYFEPKDGIFRDDILEKALQWCVRRDIRLSVCLVPWRAEGDEMFTDDEKARHIDGEIWTDLPDLPTTPKNYIPSMNSTRFHEKLERVAQRIASVMARYPDHSDYISMATAQTEEFQLVRRESPMKITGFAPVDIAKWARWSNGKPVPTSVHSEEQLNYLMDTPDGRMWFEFQTNALRESQAALTRGARKGGVRACGFYAGIGAPSGVFDFSTKLNTIFSAGTPDQPDVIYSSEGGAETLITKDMSVDLNLGTFPGAAVAIEFDWNDVSENRKTPEEGFNPNAMWIHTSSAFRRGADISHLAMSYPEHILLAMTETLYRIQKDFIKSDKGMTGIVDGGSFDFPITRYSGLQGFRHEWEKRGGGTEKQVKIRLQ